MQLVEESARLLQAERVARVAAQLMGVSAPKAPIRREPYADKIVARCAPHLGHLFKWVASTNWLDSLSKHARVQT